MRTHTFTVAFWLANILLSVVAQNAANAQTLGRVSLETGGWAYIPVLHDDASVQAIVALRVNNPSAAIVALWCEPEQAGVWSAVAWNDVSHEAVASFVFETCGGEVEDGSLEDMVHMWPVELDPTAVLQLMDSPVAPIPFGDGVPVGDPFEIYVQSAPGLLGPLEAVGYPAVADLSGSPVSGGTFTPNPIHPVPTDCLRASELLGVLKFAFEASATDGSVVDTAFQDESDRTNSACGCRVRTVTTSETGWTDTCGPWVQTGGPIQSGTDCRYEWQRDVEGRMTRVREHTYADCTKATCTQTKFRNGIQFGNSIGVVAPGGVCAPTGPLPTATCQCSGFFYCQTGPWVPAVCPW